VSLEFWENAIHRATIVVVIACDTDTANIVPVFVDTGVCSPSVPREVIHPAKQVDQG
jgi:hypothetical protein